MQVIISKVAIYRRTLWKDDGSAQLPSLHESSVPRCPSWFLQSRMLDSTHRYSHSRWHESSSTVWEPSLKLVNLQYNFGMRRLATAQRFSPPSSAPSFLEVEQHKLYNLTQTHSNTTTFERCYFLGHPQPTAWLSMIALDRTHFPRFFQICVSSSVFLLWVVSDR